MRVLMISANTEQINMPVLPIGMARVAAAVQLAGHEVQIVNLMDTSQVLEALEKSVSSFVPDVVGISVRNIDDQHMQSPHFMLPPVQEVVQKIRSLCQAPVILGGPGYSIFPWAALEYLQADFGLQGEGESAFCLLLQRLDQNRPCNDIPGLVSATGQHGPAPERIRNLDLFPLPQPGKHLDIPEDIDRSELWVPFQTRRGCPLNCSYCSTPAIEGRIMRRQSISLVIENLENYVAAGYKRFFLVDNIFNLPLSYTEALCEAIIKADLDISWQCIFYPISIPQRLAEKMARAGCAGVALGFESGSPQVLKAMNKRFGPEDVRQCASALGQQGISRAGFLLLGGPGETRETVQESFDFADSLQLDLMKITPGIRVYPWTELARKAREIGMIPADTNLLYPAFYLQPGLEGWLQAEVERMAEEKDNWYT